MLSVASCAILFPVSERNTKMNNTNIIDRVDSENANLRSQIDRLTGMEKHTLENWGKLPEGWTRAKELENNLKDIRRNLKNSA